MSTLEHLTTPCILVLAILSVLTLETSSSIFLTNFDSSPNKDFQQLFLKLKNSSDSAKVWVTAIDSNISVAQRINITAGLSAIKVRDTPRLFSTEGGRSCPNVPSSERTLQLFAFAAYSNTVISPVVAKLVTNNASDGKSSSKPSAVSVTTGYSHITVNFSEASDTAFEGFHLATTASQIYVGPMPNNIASQIDSQMGEGQASPEHCQISGASIHTMGTSTNVSAHTESTNILAFAQGVVELTVLPKLQTNGQKLNSSMLFISSEPETTQNSKDNLKILRHVNMTLSTDATIGTMKLMNSGTIITSIEKKIKTDGIGGYSKLFAKVSSTNHSVTIYAPPNIAIDLRSPSERITLTSSQNTMHARASNISVSLRDTNNSIIVDVVSASYMLFDSHNSTVSLGSSSFNGAGIWTKIEAASSSLKLDVSPLNKIIRGELSNADIAFRTAFSNYAGRFKHTALRIDTELPHVEVRTPDDVVLEIREEAFPVADFASISDGISVVSTAPNRFPFNWNASETPEHIIEGYEILSAESEEGRASLIDFFRKMNQASPISGSGTGFESGTDGSSMGADDNNADGDGGEPTQTVNVKGGLNAGGADSETNGTGAKSKSGDGTDTNNAYSGSYSGTDLALNKPDTNVDKTESSQGSGGTPNVVQLEGETDSMGENNYVNSYGAGGYGGSANGYQSIGVNKNEPGTEIVETTSIKVPAVPPISSKPVETPKETEVMPTTVATILTNLVSTIYNVTANPVQSDRQSSSQTVAEDGSVNKNGASSQLTVTDGLNTYAAKPLSVYGAKNKEELNWLNQQNDFITSRDNWGALFNFKKFQRERSRLKEMEQLGPRQVNVTNAGDHEVIWLNYKLLNADRAEKMKSMESKIGQYILTPKPKAATVAAMSPENKVPKAAVQLKSTRQTTDAPGLKFTTSKMISNLPNSKLSHKNLPEILSTRALRTVATTTVRTTASSSVNDMITTNSATLATTTTTTTKTKITTRPNTLTSYISGTRPTLRLTTVSSIHGTLNSQESDWLNRQLKVQSRSAVARDYRFRLKTQNQKLQILNELVGDALNITGTLTTSELNWLSVLALMYRGREKLFWKDRVKNSLNMRENNTSNTNNTSIINTRSDTTQRPVSTHKPVENLKFKSTVIQSHYATLTPLPSRVGNSTPEQNQNITLNIIKPLNLTDDNIFEEFRNNPHLRPIPSFRGALNSEETKWLKRQLGVESRKGFARVYRFKSMTKSKKLKALNKMIGRDLNITGTLTSDELDWLSRLALKYGEREKPFWQKIFSNALKVTQNITSPPNAIDDEDNNTQLNTINNITNQEEHSTIHINSTTESPQTSLPQNTANETVQHHIKPNIIRPLNLTNDDVYEEFLNDPDLRPLTLQWIFQMAAKAKAERKRRTPRTKATKH